MTGNYSWPESVGNTVVTLPCTFGPDGSTASRECTLYGIWQAPDMQYCMTFLTYQLRLLVWHWSFQREEGGVVGDVGGRVIEIKP